MSLKSMENTLLFCPDMSSISELVLTPFMESPVKSTFIEYLLCALALRPKAESHRIAFSEGMQVNQCKPGQQRSIYKVHISRRSGEGVRETLVSGRGEAPHRKSDTLGRFGRMGWYLSDRRTGSSQGTKEMAYTKA